MLTLPVHKHFVLKKSLEMYNTTTLATALRSRSITAQKNPMSNFFNGLKFFLIYLAYGIKLLYRILFFSSHQIRSHFHFIASDFLKLHFEGGKNLAVPCR